MLRVPCNLEVWIFVAATGKHIMAVRDIMYLIFNDREGLTVGTLWIDSMPVLMAYKTDPELAAFLLADVNDFVSHLISRMTGSQRACWKYTFR